MTATDFLDRRDGEKELGPANWGWRGRVRRWSGGRSSRGWARRNRSTRRPGTPSRRTSTGRARSRSSTPRAAPPRPPGCSPPGYTFGTVRGGGVVAWDNNETRGTLGIRGTRSSHRNTTRELLEDLGRFKDVYQSRIGDLGAFVRSQGDAHFDVLASDERPDVTGMIRADGLQGGPPAARALLPGHPGRHRQQHARRELARRRRGRRPAGGDQHGPRGHRLQRAVDARRAPGRGVRRPQAQDDQRDLRPLAQVDAKLAHDLEQVYEQRTRAVYRVPYDPILVSGSVVPYAQLSEGTRESWLRACAGMAESSLALPEPERAGRGRGPLVERPGEAARVGVAQPYGDLRHARAPWCSAAGSPRRGGWSRPARGTRCRAPGACA